MINIAVFGATVSYVLMTLSHVVLRRREPDLERPYRTPGGIPPPRESRSCSRVPPSSRPSSSTRRRRGSPRRFFVMVAYFWFFSRHRLVADAPEEEFAAIERAESELAGG